MIEITGVLLGSKRHLLNTASSNSNVQKSVSCNVIESDFTVHMSYRQVKMNTMEDHKIPKNATEQNTLEILMKNMKKMDTEKQQTKHQNVISITKLVMSFYLWCKKNQTNILIQLNLYMSS